MITVAAFRIVAGTATARSFAAKDAKAAKDCATDGSKNCRLGLESSFLMATTSGSHEIPEVVQQKTFEILMAETAGFDAIGSICEICGISVRSFAVCPANPVSSLAILSQLFRIVAVRPNADSADFAD